MPEEVTARPLDVLADLVGELQCRAELLLAAEETMKVDADRVAIHVRVEVDDVALDRRRVVLIERGSDADIGDALERAREALESRRRHVDAAAREQIVCGIDIDGWKPDLASEAAAGGDAAVDVIRTSQRESGGVKRAFGDGVADQR